MIENQSLIPALFVSDAGYLKTNPGGVQICTQEYIRTLERAGFRLHFLSYSPDMKLLTRLTRKLFPQPYTHRLPSNLAQQVIAYAKENRIETIFLNQVDTAPIARQLREQLGSSCKLVLLSHGLESTDLFHGMRTKNDSEAFSQATAQDLRFLAQSLVAEHQHRQFIDQVFCLSSFETELERWLGARQVDWLPRTIPNQPLDWHPDASRLGFVGTLDHFPNREGLFLFLRAFQPIAPPHIRVRLVGGPQELGETIAQQFPCVDYLGKLSNEQLEQEAKTWSCLVHPLFCYPRGCSTKLAIALGWQIPVVTTPAGCRGYTWNQGNLPLAETPEAFAELVLQMLQPEIALKTQREITAIAHSSPSLADIASKVRACLSMTLN